MRAERFGSYSTVATFAGMSFLSRLKSITRYSRLCPPPRHQEVRWPLLSRPPELSRFSVNGRYGSFVVISSKVSDVLPRTPGEVGLYLRIAMVLRSLQEVRKLLAVPQLHVRLFPVRATADVLALALELAVRQRRADALHLRAEQRLDGSLDVDLVGVHRHLEFLRLAVLAEDRGLLGNEGAQQHACQFHNSQPAAGSWQLAAAGSL